MNDLEYFPTPSKFVIPCVQHLFRSALSVGWVIDVCAGAGEFTHEWIEQGYCGANEHDASGKFRNLPLMLDMVDRRDGKLGVEMCEFVEADFLKWSAPKHPVESGFDVVMMNPPFSRAVDFILHARNLLRPHGVLGVFLSQAYLSGVDRFDRLWLPYKPQTILIFNRRIQHNGSCDRHGRIFVIFGAESASVTTTVFVNIPE